MSDLVMVRAEGPDDIGAVRALNCAAFEGEGEADLVDALRQNGKLVVSLVAKENGEVVGHIAFSEVMVAGEQGEFTALGLAPVAVVPERQGQGIGSRLIEVGLDKCFELGHKIVFVLGHPSYYPRFGFVSAASLGLRWEIEVPEDAFMVREHPVGALAGRGGVVKFQEEFGSV